MGQPALPRFCFILIASLALSGCGFSWSSDRQSNPAIQGATYASLSGRRIEYIATTASRRLFVINDDKASGVVRICAEPPPDVGEAFSAAFASALQVAAEQGNDTTIGVAGQTARQAATAIAPLLYRTQGLQLYRDAQWALCNDLLSKYINEGDYRLERRYAFDKAAELIKSEFTVMLEAQKAFWANWNPSGPLPTPATPPPAKDTPPKKTPEPDSSKKPEPEKSSK